MAPSHSRFQFSLLNLFAMMCLVGLFLGMRSSYMFAADESSQIIERAHRIPLLIVAVAIVVDWIRFPTLRILRTVALGATVSLMTACALTIEVAEGYRRMGYWNWGTDLPAFVAITSAFGLLGGLLGLAAAAIRKLVTSIAARLPTRLS